MTWLGTNERDFTDLVFYQLRGRKLRSLDQTIGNIRFLTARARFGTSSMEGLLRDYTDAQVGLRADTGALCQLASSLTRLVPLLLTTTSNARRRFAT